MATSLVVFDLDGTLIDSRRDLADSANALIGAYGAAPLPETEITRMVGDGARVLVERAFAAAGLGAVTDAHVSQFVEIYGRHLTGHTVPYEGVEDLVTALAARGHVAVVTNKPGGPTRRLLEHFGLLPYVAFVAGGDGPFPRKPAPDSTLAAMAALSASARDTVFVGDSHVDARTARAAGVRFCFARYGFGATQMPDGLVGPGDWAIDRAGDLLDLIAAPPPASGASHVNRG